MKRSEAIRAINAIPTVVVRATGNGDELRVTYSIQEIARRYPELTTRGEWIKKAEALAYYDEPQGAFDHAQFMAKEG